MDDVKVGDHIKILNMEGGPQYKDREGMITHIDDAGQVHGTCGGCALIPEIDTFILIPTQQLKQKVLGKPIDNQI